MAVPYSTWSALGVSYLFWGIVDSSGYLVGTLPASANGDSSGMARLKGISNVSVAIPETPRVNVQGDNGVTTQFVLSPAELPSGTLTSTVFDQVFATKTIGTLIETEGDFDWNGVFPSCYDFARIALIVNSPANIQDSGDLDVGAWYVTIMLNTTVQPMKAGDMATGAAIDFASDLTLKRADKQIWGKAFTTGTNGSTSFSMIQFASPSPITAHTFIGNGATTAVTLLYTPAANDGLKVKVWKDGVELAYTSDYTTSGTTLTFGVAPAAGTKNVILYQFSPEC